MKKCFVISPIGEEGSEIRTQADEALQYVIKPACDNKGFDIIRSDMISDNGMITQSIIENILQADLAIADLTNRNPNVFYELAIRHSYGLPVIQITRDDMSNIPFDVHNVRTIQYSLSAKGADKASEEIEKVIDYIEQGNKPLNPVTSVANILNISSDTGETDNAVLSELLLKVNNIPDRLEQLENNIGTRFAQAISTYIQSNDSNNAMHNHQANIKDAMLGKLLETIMSDPEKGINQFNNLMHAQKVLEQNGFIKNKE